MLDQLHEMEGRALAELAGHKTEQALEQWHVAFLGRKGALTELLRGIGRLSAEERPAFGQEANRVKTALEKAYEDRALTLKQEAALHQLAREQVDVTLPGRPIAPGFLHVSTRTLREIYDIFAAMGFQVVEAPEVETDIYNFQLLNMPPHHPARDMWNTFHTTHEGVLLRTHTSPGQIRVMLEHCPEPIRVILPGKCYRYEQVTARHEFMFYQVEGLAIGEHLTMADLKGTLASFARQMFGPERKVRFRASYFPFTEPSAELDIDCVLCGGKGCRVCKNSGWLEILGCGMVHPNVMRNGGYDPACYTGFAFGMGPERIAMLKYGIDDIRHFFANDLRFLQQFV
jgi:phenylalanyl-tRNA synthetase alpha chain